MKLISLLIILIASTSFARIGTGLDVLYESNFKELRGKRIGYICNQTSRTGAGEFGPDILLHSEKLRIAAFFSPEHGFKGHRKAGIRSDSIETYDGIPIHSLYGATRKPSKKMLTGIDILVFDMQDIGVRAYTYLSTMLLAMEAAAENNISFVVLDRPNPLGGERIEGGILDTMLRSFVGAAPIPYIHGMTLGELALMAKAERWIGSANKLQLKIIPMSGWSRSMMWNDTELSWTAPSPNIPTALSAIGCAMTGAIGELGILSVGIGSDMPFQRIGSRLVTSKRIKDLLTAYLPPSVKVSEDDFMTPFGDTVKSYNGVRIDLAKLGSGNIFSAQFILLKVLVETDSVFRRSYDAIVQSSKSMFDKVVGTKELRQLIESDAQLGPLLQRWDDECRAFRMKRQKFLLYR